MVAISTPARLMLRPFRTYAEVAQAEVGAGRPTAVGGMARFLFVFGAFISVTATGRFAPFELFSAILSMAYVPVNHFIAIAIVTRVFARKVPARRVYALYAEGYGPWFVMMLLIAGGSLFAHEPARLLSATSGLLILGTLAWSIVLTLACFRSALGLTWPRAIGATLLHYAIAALLVLGYYIAAGQLLPIIP